MHLKMKYMGHSSVRKDKKKGRSALFSIRRRSNWLSVERENHSFNARSQSESINLLAHKWHEKKWRVNLRPAVEVLKLKEIIVHLELS